MIGVMTLDGYASVSNCTTVVATSRKGLTKIVTA